MATITSTQSGNFNATTTWVGGVVPVDGDNFIVNYGHLVTINDDRRVTNGYNDSHVRGKLHITGTGKLRMNGHMYVDNAANYAQHFVEGQDSAGFFRMDPAARLEIRGTNSETHRLWGQPPRFITIEVEGTNPNPQTTIIEDAANNSAVLTFDAAAEFAPGDWINVYKASRPGKSWLYNKSDEGFWIHDIDYVENYVYVRHFVSPTAVIQSVSGATVVLDNAAVFRKGQLVIFGTGANLNTRTISAINYTTNTLTLSANVVGTVTGQTVYCTGTEKAHFAGDDVLRVASVMTADCNAFSNTITVNNVNGFNVGDLILIPNNNPADTGTWDYVMDYTVAAINAATKTITLSSGFTSTPQSTIAFNAKAGNIIVNLQRDTQITAPEGTLYNTDQRSFVYLQYHVADYSRRVTFLNTLFRLGSNSLSSEHGTLTLRGYRAWDLTGTATNSGIYVSEINGCVFMPIQRDNYWSNMFWEQHQLNNRNNVFYNYNGLGVRRSGNNTGWFSNIAARVSGRGFLLDGGYEPFGQISYNYIIRAWQGWEFDQWNDATLVNHNYAFFTDTLCYGAYAGQGGRFDRMYSDYFRRWPHWTRVGLVYFTNSYFGNRWDATSPDGAGLYSADGIDQADESYNQLQRAISAYASLTVSLCHNFEYNKSAMNNRQALRIWDPGEQAWRVRPDLNDSSWKGFANLIFVPAGCTVTLRGHVKMGSAANTNYPHIFARNYWDGTYSGRYFTLNDAAITSFSDTRFTQSTGCLDTSQRFTGAGTQYETKSLTIGPLSFDVQLLVGIAVNNAAGAGNSRLGWWERDFEIHYDTPDHNLENVNIVHQLTTRRNISMPGTIIKTNKLRLGG